MAGMLTPIKPLTVSCLYLPFFYQILLPAQEQGQRYSEENYSWTCEKVRLNCKSHIIDGYCHAGRDVDIIIVIVFIDTLYVLYAVTFCSFPQDNQSSVLSYALVAQD